MIDRLTHGQQPFDPCVAAVPVDGAMKSALDGLLARAFPADMVDPDARRVLLVRYSYYGDDAATMLEPASAWWADAALAVWPKDRA